MFATWLHPPNFFVKFIYLGQLPRSSLLIFLSIFYFNIFSDSLFTNFTVFKQELPSPPTYREKSPNDTSYTEGDFNQQQNGYSSRGDASSGPRQGDSGIYIQNGNGAGAGIGQGQNGSSYGQHSDFEDNGSPVNNQQMILENHSETGRFQYILQAATAIAQKSNEDSLTYLNQGQSYEIKLKKLGDLSACRGKVFKSIIKICFHERRLQYMEKEQMRLWQDARPGERILELDIPLTYGITHFSQPPNSNFSNMVEVMWDPFQDCGIYIRVNCISTEFTPKKHGGEKGVPFRIQIETYDDNNYNFDKPLRPTHAAACQIKVNLVAYFQGDGYLIISL